jgi:photosystem II stability/assembly factor-like uncharacterized protein
MIQHTLFVGTIGEGVFRSLDHGETFRRAMDGPGVFVESQVRALAVHPSRPGRIYMGNEQGLFRSDDRAGEWQRIASPCDGHPIWSILLGTGEPETIIVGCCPARLFQSPDAGVTWRTVGGDFVRDCPRILSTRVTTLAADPNDPQLCWAGVEIDSVWHTTDGGTTWEKQPRGLSSQDIHSLVVLSRVEGRPRRLLAATNNDLNLSEDDGKHWRKLDIGKQLPRTYCRAMTTVPGKPRRILLGIGDGPPGWSGFIAFSEDAGETWSLAGMPGPSNSTIWNFAQHLADPNLLYASSVSGQVYRSVDAGSTWTKLAREFGEIRALAWTPA